MCFPSSPGFACAENKAIIQINTKPRLERNFSSIKKRRAVHATFNSSIRKRIEVIMQDSKFAFASLRSELRPLQLSDNEFDRLFVWEKCLPDWSSCSMRSISSVKLATAMDYGKNGDIETTGTHTAHGLWLTRNTPLK